MRYSSLFLLLLSFSLSARLLAQNNASAHAAQSNTAEQDSINGTLTLPQAVAIAIRNNLSVAQSDLNSQGYKIQYDQSWEYMLPTLSANGGQNIYFGRSISTTNNQYFNSQFSGGNAGLNAGLLLFHGLELQNNFRAQRYAYNASKLDLQQQKDNITLNTLLAYLQVLNSRDQVQLAHEQAEVDSITLQRLTAQGKAGALAPVSNLTDLQGRYAGDQVNIANAINNLEANKVALFAILNVPYKRDVEYQNSIAATDINDYQANSDSIFQHALNIIPSIRSAQLKVLEYRSNLAYYRGAYYPSISLGANVSTNWTNAPAASGFVPTGTSYIPSTSAFLDPTGNTPVYDKVTNGYNTFPTWGDQFKNNRSESIGINVNIPILNGFQARNNVRQAKLNLKNYQLLNRNAHNYLQQQVELAFQNMIAAYKSFKFYQQEVVAYKESFRVTNIRFTEGVIASDAYILAKGNSDAAEVNLAAAKYAYIFRTKVLDYYQGKLTIE
jgi:outer membrane protein